LKLVASILILFVVTVKAGNIVEPQNPAEASYNSQIIKWRSDRIARLKSDDGWLSLVGLYWLKNGENRFGSDPSNEIVISGENVPKHAGSFWLENQSVRLEVHPGVEISSEGKAVTSMALQSDGDKKPTVLSLGSLNFFVIKRVNRFGIRLKDKESLAIKQFAGLDYFPVNRGWRVQAKFEKYSPPKSIPIINVLAMLENQDSPGAIVFQRDGKTYRLDAIQEEPHELFIIFADSTSGKETYGAGRYLYTDMPDTRGNVIIDFNKAYNPPCAFTNYATCPLPPPQNRLQLRIEAGEKKYTSKAH
jgi:uncharacterized protein